MLSSPASTVINLQPISFKPIKCIQALLQISNTFNVQSLSDAAHICFSSFGMLFHF